VPRLPRRRRHSLPLETRKRSKSRLGDSLPRLEPSRMHVTVVPRQTVECRRHWQLLLARHLQRLKMRKLLGGCPLAVLQDERLQETSCS
jgi:hypothetical protein